MFWKLFCRHKWGHCRRQKRKCQVQSKHRKQDSKQDKCVNRGNKMNGTKGNWNRDK